MVSDCECGLKNLFNDWGLRERVVLSRVLEPQLGGLRIQSRACIVAGEKSNKAGLWKDGIHRCDVGEGGEWMVMWVLRLSDGSKAHL